MKDRVRGILIQNGSIALMHRIKKINNEVLDYYVVPGGGVENGESLEEALKREMLEEVGIGIRIYPHKLRHTFATRCFEKGMDPLVVQALMGHSNYATTISYTHVLDDKLKKEVESVGSFFE